jgi:recombination protein RecR
MNSIDKLSEMFARFPGIGPRQAKRFVYFLLSRHDNTSEDLVRAIQNLRKEITQCGECMRYYPSVNSAKTLCSVCSNSNRDSSMLMVVPHDIDLEAVERSGTYSGLYFVLGGSVPILEKEPDKRIRINSLETRIKRDWDKIEEIILAMNANSDGENTVDYLKDRLKPFSIEISVLGRGLSTGAELEYADPETLRNAFMHRTK